MRLFGKKTFGRSSWRGAGHHAKDGNDPDDDSIGSAISTKDQFDIVIPVKASSSNAHNHHSNSVSATTKSWGASLLMGGLLDSKNAGAGASSSGNPHGHGEDDTTVSSITTSPEWQQAYSPTAGDNTNNADGAANGPFGARHNNHKSGSSGYGGDDGHSSWACCCAPVTGGADDDYYYDEGREPPSASLGGRSPALTGSTLAPTAHYRPAQYWGRRGATGADPIVAVTSTPSILAPPETRHDDEEGDEEALDPHLAVAATERSLATAPIDNSGGGAAAPAATTPEASTSTSSEAWCCAGAAATLGLAGLCFSAPHPEGTSTDPKDAAAASSSDAWNARRSHSLFDGLDDDEAHGANGNTKGNKDGLKSKIKHLRRAIVPWGSHLRQRSKSFRRSKNRNHNNGATSEDAAAMDPGAPMAILATTDRDDHYYWKGAAAE
jgi:hypothetical protein